MSDQLDFQTEEKKNFLKTKKGKICFSFILSVVILLILFFCVFFFLRPAPPSEKNPTTSQSETKEKEKIENALPDDEIRGVYIASVFNINYPSQKGLSEDQLKAELDTIVEKSRLTGFDTIYFQVRPSGDALYRSEIFPSSRYLVSKEGEEISFDSLSYLTEKAKEFDMSVVAWVNPYRITVSNAKSKEAALETLSENNPAKLHPDWTVFYGGKLYYDPSLSQVRDLIASGVKEICEGYDVAGILYDDYFYPYPVEGEDFDDAKAYEKSGTKLSLENWRRENVNQMVKLSYDTVKAVSKDLTFGISPFGIWKNASSDPRGSDTRGMEAYSSLYCDALAWIEGRYIDYISPQIYWERGFSAADFATLTRWWSAQVDGTGIGLVISHAAYRAGEFTYGGDEIAQQIRYARNYMGSCGSIQYGFEDILKNTEGVQDALKEVFADTFLEEEPVEEVSGVSFVYPRNGVTTELSSQFVSISSDPDYPVYSSGAKVGRTKSGFISILFPLSMGENRLTLEQNGTSYTLTVNRKNAGKGEDTLKNFSIASFTPSVSDGVIASSGIQIPVSVTAPAGCTVSATLGEQKVALSPTILPKGNDGILKEIYEGSITIPTLAEGDEPISVGAIQYTLSFQGQEVKKEGAAVQVIPSNISVKGTVTEDYAMLKTSPHSSFYEDFTPSSVGMTDEVIAFYDGYYLLSFGGFVAKEDLQVEFGASVSESILDKVTYEVSSSATDFTFHLGASPALSVSNGEESVKVTLFRTTTELKKEMKISPHSPLFSSAKIEKGEEDHTVVLNLKLHSKENYYGFDYKYENGKIVLSFRNPSSLSDSALPLTGKCIAVDAGHGGTDIGALGFYSKYNEKDLNLSIALLVRDKITSLGGKVLMTREDDSTVSLNDRMDFLTNAAPDLSVSIHHNSTGEGSDANAARGTLGLYWSASGTSLSDKIQKRVKAALGSRDLGSKEQKLALCRNHRFPQTLIEVSFICSPAEYERSMRGDYAEKVSDAIVEGILDWYKIQENYLKGENK